MNEIVTRPVLRWHGGKYLLAPWVVEHLPRHRIYVEPFGGAASVLLRKPRSYAEVYNDLDVEVVNLFRVLRGPRARDLVEAVRLTPFSRDEHLAAYLADPDPVERARQLIIRSFMGFGSNGCHRATGFRANSNKSGTTPSRDWANYPDALAVIVDRLTGVVVENRDAKEVMAGHDGPETLHYVDPPYVFATRTDAAADYAHELSDDDHAELLAFLKTLRGGGGALRVSVRLLRRRPQRLDADRAPRAGRRRLGSHRGSLDQSQGRRRPARRPVRGG